MNNMIWMACGFINIAIALLHIYIIVAGADAFRYFGAGEWMASQHEAGSWIPASITLAVTAVFCVFALYNFAGAGYYLTPLPFVFWALVGIAVIYILRGAAVVLIPFIDQPHTQFDVVSSFISLAIGLLHAVGVYTLYSQKVVL